MFDNVLGLVLRGEPERVTPPGIEVRPSGEAEFESWLDIVLHGFAYPDTPGVPVHGELPREVIAGAGRDFAAAGGIFYIALRDGVIAGGARLRMAEGVAQLAGATTAPRAPPPGGAGRAAVGPARRRRSRRLRHRRRDHAARIEVAAEHAEPGLRPALYPRRLGAATLSLRAPALAWPDAKLFMRQAGLFRTGRRGACATASRSPRLVGDTLGLRYLRCRCCSR